MKNRIISSVNNLIPFIHKQRGENKHIWFRGHAVSTWKLLPSLARKKSWIKSEQDLIRRFKQNATLLIDKKPQSDLEWLFIMQHYGAPTRLLDWTENALFALWFAVWEKKHVKKDGEFIMLFPRRLNDLSNIKMSSENEIPSFEDDYFKNYEPLPVSQGGEGLHPIAGIANRNTSRMQMQLGVFTICNRDPIPVDFKNNGSVIKATVPSRKKKLIIEELALLGISKTQIFPELPALGEAMLTDLKNRKDFK